MSCEGRSAWKSQLKHDVSNQRFRAINKTMKCLIKDWPLQNKIAAAKHAHVLA